MAKGKKFYAQDGEVFQAPTETDRGMTMGFRLCTCNQPEHAEQLARMLNEHLECQSILQQLIGYIAPTVKAEMHLTQGLSAARLQAKQLLNRMLAP